LSLRIHPGRHQLSAILTSAEPRRSNLVNVADQASGSVDGPADGAIGGYTLLRATDLDSAAQLVANHRFISRGGTLQVSEAVDVGT
jgi:hypothetical protein